MLLLIWLVSSSPTAAEYGMFLFNTYLAFLEIKIHGIYNVVLYMNDSLRFKKWNENFKAEQSCVQQGPALGIKTDSSKDTHTL